MKLVALVITLGLWLGVTGLSTPREARMTGIPLALRYPPDKEITNSPIDEVSIRVSGDERKIAQINKTDLVVSVDMSDAVPGFYEVNLKPESVAISLPTGIRLDAIEPNQISVRLEAVEEKDIQVKAETVGELPEGFEIYDQTVTPPRVRIRGPASVIRSLEFASTEPIDLSGHNADFSARQVPVGVSNPKAIPLQTAVDVQFRIGGKRIERMFSVPVRDSARAASVVLYGPASVFENITAEEFRVEIVKTESGTETPRLLMPPSLEGKIEVRQVRLR
ncbi:MAG: hypothetical protein LC730_01475 [Acidobacteria bacterium]|nr:hypothetical protein [Acidobacteriota bacterium]MCA1608116.1 hypothetical protein [Acidobacteriota bacterium]